MNERADLKTLVVMSAFLFAAACTPAPARIIYVDDDANGLNDGSSWTNAYNYLQDALADANSSPKPVEVRVAQGIYKPDQGIGIKPGDRTATFQLINGVAIYGGYAGFGEADPNSRDFELYETILSGDLDGNDVDVNDPFDLWNEPTLAENSYHVVTASNTDSNAVLDGFTITAGNANGKMRNYYGGGLYNTHNGSPALANCTFTRNSANTGGGMGNGSGDPMLTNCTFTGNLADYIGGAVHNGGSVRLMTCIFIGNSSYYGGGMYNEYHTSRAVLINCIFVGNCVKGCGGGIFHYLSDLILVNCTFVGNSAREGGGIFIPPIPVPATASPVKGYYGISTISNSILWDNWPEQIVDSMGFSLAASYSDIQGGWSGTGSIDEDPCFASSGYWGNRNDSNIIVEPNDPNAVWIDGDYHLKSEAGRWDPTSASWVKDNVTSPCIDAGDMNSPIGLEPFPNGGVINMGAYGGTAEASKSYFGDPLCETIVAGDINGDCMVNWTDFAIMARHWLEEHNR